MASVAEQRLSSEKRRAIARSVVDLLAAQTELRDSNLVGSAAPGNSVDHSDIDLINYYEQVPESRSFDEALLAMGAEPKGLISPATEDGFAARYSIDGIELQTGGTSTVSMEDRLDRIAAGDVVAIERLSRYEYRVLPLIQPGQER